MSFLRRRCMIFRSSSAATCSSDSGELWVRVLAACRISEAVLPVAQIKNTYPNFSSYCALATERDESVPALLCLRAVACSLALQLSSRDVLGRVSPMRGWEANASSHASRGRDFQASSTFAASSAPLAKGLALAMAISQ